MGNLIKRLAPIVAAGAVSLFSLIGCQPVTYTSPTLPTIPTPTEQVPTQPSIVLDPEAVEPRRLNQVLIYDHSDNESGFNLERKTGNGNFIPLANLPANSELYNDWGVATSTQYAYRIRAYNNSGSSSWYESTTTSVGTQTGFKSTQVTADTFVFEGAPGYPSYANNNYGTNGNVEISGLRQNYTGGVARGLLQFQIPSLPSYSLGYQGANLILNDASGSANPIHYPSPIEMYAFLNLNSWNENTVTDNTRPGEWLSDAGHIIQYADSSGHIRNINIDISNLASYWYSSKFPNYGANYGLTLYTPTNESYWYFYSKEGYQPGSAYLKVSYTW